MFSSFLFSFLTVLPGTANSREGYGEDGTFYIEVRRLPERPENVPGSVNLLTRAAIENESLRSPADIAGAVPGFSFNDPFGRYNPAPSIRGLIQPGLGDDPSVGFFTDGLYLSGRSSINSLAFDLEKVEVAKGPQNALYGRNSFGGAINAVGMKPQNDFSAWFDGRRGQHEREEFTAGVNVPFSEKLKSRLAVYWRDWGGYFNNTQENGPDIGRERTRAAKLTTTLDPTPDRQITLRVGYAEDHDGQPKGFLTPTNCGPRTTDGVFRLFCGELPEGQDSYAANDVGTEQPMGYIREHGRGSLEWVEEFSSRTKLTTLIGGAVEDSVFIRDDDYQAVNASRAGIDTDRFDGQFDTRLNSATADGAWRGLAGFSVYRFFNKVDRLDQNYVLGDTQPGGARVKNSTDTAGVYGSLTRRFESGFALTGDGRWQWEEKNLKSSTVAVSTGQPIALDDSWTAFTPKLTLSWQGSDTPLYYTSVARGYKTGGFNDRANIFDGERTYDPEKNITYEAGVKNIRAADTLFFDAGGFYIDWNDQQVLAYSSAGATQNFFLNNAGETTVKGLELNARWVPAERLTVEAGYAYIDARYDSYNDPDLRNVSGFAPTGDVSGNRLPRHSPHQASVSLSYRTDSPVKDWDLVLGSQLRYESSQYTDNSNTARTGDRTMLNLQAGIERPGGYIGLWVDNALNERDPAVGIPWFDASQGFRREWLVVPEDGVTAGVRVRASF